ncbi:hypothetical protein DPMN_113102 [Dreissena polymorpha]|uniref:Uncharacterized protein n=1 Tax=Dreissena polymorpha TaxID=45954 RepID=A0A9D4QQI4_DREPO|nr:hypothetical protein DPMN_113102 [Dreissena polymorpha]
MLVRSSAYQKEHTLPDSKDHECKCLIYRKTCESLRYKHIADPLLNAGCAPTEVVRGTGH